MAVAGQYTDFDVDTLSMSHCEGSDIEAGADASEIDPVPSVCAAVGFCIGDMDVSVQAAPATCEAGVQASCDARTHKQRWADSAADDAFHADVVCCAHQ